MPDSNRPPLVLLVEDNHADAELMAEAFAEAAPLVRLECAVDGEAALARLRGEGEHAGTTLPALVLLDLNLPRKHGKSVLADMRTDARLRHLPVLVLTTSPAEHDVRECYLAGANAYLTKPVGYLPILDMVRAITGFWLTLAVLPKEAR
ncbi:MAG TPA: response regulator [bacterium]|nr:response regulator [bacterium]